MDSISLSAKLKFYSRQNKIELVAWKVKMLRQNWGMTVLYDLQWWFKVTNMRISISMILCIFLTWELAEYHFSSCCIDSLSSPISTIVIDEIAIDFDLEGDMIWQFLCSIFIFEWFYCHHFRYWLQNWCLVRWLPLLLLVIIILPLFLRSITHLHQRRF